MWGRVTHVCNFGTPNILGTVEARDFKFRRETGASAVSSNEKNAKLGIKGSRGGHMTQFFEFCDP